MSASYPAHPNDGAAARSLEAFTAWFETLAAYVRVKHGLGEALHKWGYGLLLNTADVPGMRRAGSGSWAGLRNTHFWIDPATGVCGSVYSNFLPFVTPEAFALYNDFERALYASL